MRKLSYQINFKRFFHRKKLIFPLALLICTIFVWFALLAVISNIDDSALLSRRTQHITIPPTAPYVMDRLVIRFKEGFEPSKSIDDTLQKAGIISYERLYQTNNSVSNTFYLAVLEKGRDITKIQEKLKNLPFLASSEPNFISKIFSIPNDPSFSEQWAMEKIESQQAWDIATGSENVVAAVVDTGITLNHPDLEANLVNGIDIINRDSDPSDDMGHGTHIAGIIGAVGNNNLGVAGVNWKVKIMPIKACNPAPPPVGSTCFPEEGIYYATDNGAKVINLSVGLETNCMEGSQYQTAIDYATSHGVIVVAVAGNDEKDASNYSPASCRGVITVGATTRSDTRANFSNYGSSVMISAPGEEILSTILSGYGLNQGTSMSAPHVAGTAALLLSKNPGLSPQQVKDCLVNNADTITTDLPIGPRLNVFRTMISCSDIPAVKNDSNIFPKDTNNQNTNASSKTESTTLVDNPVPTPDVLYTCSYDDSCSQGSKSLQICSLKCVPQ